MISNLPIGDYQVDLVKTNSTTALVAKLTVLEAVGIDNLIVTDKPFIRGLVDGTPFEGSNEVTLDFVVEGTGLQGIFELQGLKKAKTWELYKLNTETQSYELHTITVDSAEQQIEFKGSVETEGDARTFSIGSLDAGEYKLKLISNLTTSNIVFESASLTYIYEHQYVSDDVEQTLVKGLLLENDAFDARTTKLSIMKKVGLDELNQLVYENVAIGTSYGAGEGTVIQGNYGELKVWANGYYEYVANGVTDITALGKVEEFIYRLTGLNGDYVDSKLSITIGSNDVTMLSAHDTDIELNGRNNVDDILIANGLNNIISGNGGNDSLIYKVLSENHTGGNGQDIWHDFAVGDSAYDEADSINVSELLDGNQTTSNIREYLSVKLNGDDLILSVDRDGTESKYQQTELLTLSNFTAQNKDVTFTSNEDLLNLLMNNNQIIY